jgi:transcriptional regulator with XRE-family HTH domain
MISMEELRAQYPPEDTLEYRQAETETELSFEIAGIVYKLRKEAGLTQAGLAELIGSSQRVISRIETPGHKPNVATVEQIAKALGVQLHLSVEPLKKPGVVSNHKTDGHKQERLAS